MITLRNGQIIDLTVVLGRRETAEAAAFPADEGAPAEPETTNMLGLTLSEITPELAEAMEITADAGLVVVEVEGGSEAEEKGLLSGDLITEAGQQKIATIADFEARVEEAQEAGRKSLLLLVRRGGAPRFVALGLE